MSESRPLWSANDLKRLLVLGGGGAAAYLVPRSADRPIARLLMTIRKLRDSAETRRIAGGMGSALACGQEAARDLAEAHARMRIEDMWGRVRGVRPFGWRPEVRTSPLTRNTPPDASPTCWKIAGRPWSLHNRI